MMHHGKHTPIVNGLGNVNAIIEGHWLIGNHEGEEGHNFINIESNIGYLMIKLNNNGQ